MPATAGEASDLAQRVHERPKGRDHAGPLGADRNRHLSPRPCGRRNRQPDPFLDPEEIAGTRLISIDKAGGNTDPWRYRLGITEDDTLPLYHGYLQRIRRGVSPVFAIIRSVEASGRAVVAISIVLIAQFSLLGLSDFRPTAHFGMLCAVGLFAGQLFELLLMPALPGLRLRKPRQAVTAP